MTPPRCALVLFLPDGLGSIPPSRSKIIDVRRVRRRGMLSKGLQDFAQRSRRCGRALADRMDRRYLESTTRLHEDLPGLRTLLRGDVRRALPRRAGAPVRA